MTEEQIKFYFNLLYRHINAAPLGVSFGVLIDYANRRKIDDDLFLGILDQLEISGLVNRQGDIYVSREG